MLNLEPLTSSRNLIKVKVTKLMYTVYNSVVNSLINFLGGTWWLTITYVTDWLPWQCPLSSNEARKSASSTSMRSLYWNC